MLDGDFKKKYGDGLFLDPGIYQLLIEAIEEDTNFLESMGITDYSLIMGVRELGGNTRLQDHLGLQPQVAHGRL